MRPDGLVAAVPDDKRLLEHHLLNVQRNREAG